jgi:hypothetical protein
MFLLNTQSHTAHTDPPACRAKADSPNMVEVQRLDDPALGKITKCTVCFASGPTAAGNWHDEDEK